VSDVAREYQVSWPSAHKALVSAATAWLPEPQQTSRMGSTRPGSVRSAGSSTDNLAVSSRFEARVASAACGGVRADFGNANGGRGGGTAAR
jgi:hypothetical protein